ncbi:MMPL family transporter [Streptomyces sp. 3214.6]|uniref:MMPL family transporter n=1 Tax=Streptomyces sp. 3214.6 TaxID=1882757 RepID=UPI000C60CB35|nr:MMPL family transporter [Streptomyces sp. 3214.6]
MVGLVVAAFVLVITFGSLLAAGLPLLTAIARVVAAVCGITIATEFVPMSSASTTQPPPSRAGWGLLPSWSAGRRRRPAPDG